MRVYIILSIVCTVLSAALAEEPSKWSLTRTVTPESDTVQFYLTDAIVLHGQEICIPIRVKNYVDVLGFSFTIAWDQLITSYLEVRNIHQIVSSSAGFGGWSSQGNLAVLYYAADLETKTIADFDTLFEVCFTAYGPPGTKSPVSFVNSPTGIAVFSDIEDLPFTTKEGSIFVSSTTTENCPDTLIINQTPILSDVYQARTLLNSAGSIISGNVLFTSGNCIELHANFTVEQNATFETFILGSCLR